MRPCTDGEALHLNDDAIGGAVDYFGRPVSRFNSGRWRSAVFIIGSEIAERSAYYGVSINLISYLTGPLGESTAAAAAAAVNVWSGFSCMFPLVGALVADSYFGRYRTNIVASLLYLLVLGMLTLSSVPPSLRPTKCNGATVPSACDPPKLQVATFFFALYLVALAQSGYKPCVQAFGADQFDENDPDEIRSRSTFFNWWYFGISCGGTLTSVCLNYVQDNVSWVLGFGIPCIFMAIALAVFLFGSRTYRYYVLESNSKFSSVFLKVVKQYWKSPPSSTEASEPLLLHTSDCNTNPEEELCSQGGGCSPEAKGWLRLLPVWATCLVFAVVFSQSSTLFTKQGSTLDRRIWSRFQVPPASLQGIIGVTIMAFVPIYDRILAPAVGRLTGKPNSITPLRRIGMGMILSAITVVVAALVETKRLRAARESGLVDLPTAVIPMSIWWLIPQYALMGLSNVFAMVGLQEFFYGQVPDAFRSFGLALYLSIIGFGELVSGLLVSVIDCITKMRGQSWFSDNLNRSHVDYFYWLLAGLSVVELAIYLYFAQSYVYKKANCAA